MSQNTGFAQNLDRVFRQYGQLCFGFDPHPQVLEFHGLDNSVKDIETLFRNILEVITGHIGVLKIQVSLFERFGSAGYILLEKLFEEIRHTDIVLIADVKRGEIGSSMAGYTSAWLDNDSPLRADAMTVNPYLGVGALAATFRTAQETGRGIFVLAANSNPESFAMQRSGTPSLAKRVINEVSEFNKNSKSPGSLGVVIGATVNLDDYGIGEEDLYDLPLLAPGFGHQGAQISELNERFGSNAKKVLVAQSRSLLMVNTDDLVSRIQTEQQTIRDTVEAKIDDSVNG